MLNSLKILLLLTIFILPLLTPARFLGYEQIKVLFLTIMLSISGTIWLYLFSKKQITIPKTPIFKLGLIFLLTVFLTSLLGLDPLRSLLGRAPYLQGFILYFYLFLFYLLITTSKITLKEVAWTLTGSSFLVGSIALFQWVGLHLFNQSIPTYAGRVVSTFGQPNLYSAFLLLSIPFQYFLFKNSTKKQKILLHATFFISLLAIYLSESRAAILLIAALLSINLALHLNFKNKIILTFSFISGVILVAYIIFFGQQLWIKEFVTPSSNQWLLENSPEKRIYLWPVFLEIIKSNPILGYGLDNIPPAYSDFFTNLDFNTVNNPAYHSLRNISVDRTHNQILDLLMFAGLPGLISFLALCIFALKKSFHNQTLALGLIFYLVWMQLQPPGIMQLLYFWLLLGLIDKET